MFIIVLDSVIGRERWVQEEDIANMPYINIIVKEMMRLHAVAPLSPPRLASEDCKIVGYNIPKGTRALASTWAIGRDIKLGDDATEFRPERFIGKALDVKGKDFEALPFGWGKRTCQACCLGLREIQSIRLISCLGSHGNCHEGRKREDLNMEESYGLSMPRTNPLVALVEPKLPLHLY